MDTADELPRKIESAITRFEITCTLHGQFSRDGGPTAKAWEKKAERHRTALEKLILAAISKEKK